MMTLGCVDLDLFYSKVNFAHLDFFMGKSENDEFFRTVEDYVTKIGRSSKINEYMKYFECQRSRSFIDLGHMALGFSISNIFF